jgi:Ala-tRNA(Pro) deacylase
MAMNERLKRFLDAEAAQYQTQLHREVFTAQEVAEASHVSGRQVAKVLIAREHDRRYLMLVLPAPCRVDLNALRHAAGTGRLSLATEEELARLFPDCDVGAMPPFGNLYDVPVYVDACFSRAEDFFFQPGNHHEIVRIRYDEFERLARPVVGEFCLHEREKLASA